MNTDTNDNTVILPGGCSFTLPDRAQLISLLTSLIPTIGDDYRATDDPEDNEPGMCVTIGASVDGTWSWQTGDNSFMGGACHHPHWGVGYLYRDSLPKDVADGILDEIADGMASAI